MTEQEIAAGLAKQGWLLTRTGDTWIITPITETFAVVTLGEAERFLDGLTEGWLACSRLLNGDA